MAFIYEIIDTEGKFNSKEWKRLINISMNDADLNKLKDIFLNSTLYTYSNSKNIKIKMIEKIFNKTLDSQDLIQSAQKRKNFWIKSRTDTFGENCFIKKIQTEEPSEIKPKVKAISTKQETKQNKIKVEVEETSVTSEVDNFEIKYNEMIFTNLNDYLNNLDVEINPDSMLKAIAGNASKSFKKRYKDILANTYIKQENSWIALL